MFAGRNQKSLDASFFRSQLAHLDRIPWNLLDADLAEGINKNEMNESHSGRPNNGRRVPVHCSSFLLGGSALSFGGYGLEQPGHESENCQGCKIDNPIQGIASNDVLFQRDARNHQDDEDLSHQQDT